MEYSLWTRDIEDEIIPLCRFFILLCCLHFKANWVLTLVKVCHRDLRIGSVSDIFRTNRISRNFTSSLEAFVNLTESLALGLWHIALLVMGSLVGKQSWRACLTRVCWYVATWCNFWQCHATQYLFIWCVYVKSTIKFHCLIIPCKVTMYTYILVLILILLA